MPRGLAIETSGRSGSIALSQDGIVLSADQFSHGLKHAAGVIAIIDRLCLAQGWKPADIDEIYVSVGPGSFTGLRVGVTVAKTLAFVTGARLVAVPTVEVLARNAPPGWRNLIIVLDAKRDQIFTASFENHDGHFATREPAHLGTLAEMLDRTGRPVYLLGEGIPYHEKFIPVGDSSIRLTDVDLWRGRAEVVAELGARMALDGQFSDASQLTPIYIRKPEAEEKFEARAASAGR